MSQITLANSDVGTYDFNGLPPLSLEFGSPGLSGVAFFPSDLGTYTFGTLLPFQMAGPLVGGNFATSADQSFGYSSPSGDALDGTVHWDTVKDHSPNPDLIGTLFVANSTGSVGFMDMFSAGSAAHIDVVLAFVHPSPFLDEIAATGGQTWTYISAGEIVPGTSLVSEPWSIVLFATALAAFAWSRRGKSFFTGYREVV